MCHIGAMLCVKRDGYTWAGIYNKRAPPRKSYKCDTFHNLLRCVNKKIRENLPLQMKHDQEEMEIRSKRAGKERVWGGVGGPPKKRHLPIHGKGRRKPKWEILPARWIMETKSGVLT